jgi:SNF2 family DNA or RNA helicase
VAPLTTLTHWSREFTRWTNLNTIVYHGSIEDRRVLREHEFAYECDRPDTSVASGNSSYLKQCTMNATKFSSPWMVDVVVTSPETMIADDAVELAAVQWEVLVVDEGHRLKNHKSKLTVGLRDAKFSFRHRILLTGYVSSFICKDSSLHSRCLL